ncbi:hypothetical protein K505DRAFT_374250 [Melanomma pulvis-pyrius CBS 109.77]|uniref:Uncharacterized protein n=1 Tax=Melanomma pulvis-pyrius CBS 109.77 TaxID=1314802 RepID=A0A6A6XEI8_9PLEO|nr:hypothetical protein K505DRAFT_374250 [Melanomma pulvis-pyrius CBS 109.77]
MMVSKLKMLSWSKGRQSVEYHRTGGLLAIDTSVGGTDNETFLVSDAKSTPRSGRRPPNLNLEIPMDNTHYTCLTPASARHNSALVNSTSNLLALVNDMMRSPALSASMCPRSAPAEIHKPLPSRPRSASLPSPTLPVELPGSILLENQGFPSPPGAGSATRNTMRSVRSGSALSASVATKPSPSKVPQHKKSLSEANASLQRRSKSRPSLITSPSSTDSKLTTCSVSTNGGRTSSSDSTKARVSAEKPLQPSPLIVEGKPWTKGGGEGTKENRRDELGTPPTPTPAPRNSRQVEELKSTIVAQDQTISTLQAQFGRVRASHEAEVAALRDSHAAEVATLRDYSRVLEEQQSQRTLHHASSNHLLLLIDTTEPQSPSRESPQNTAGSASATSIRSFKSALEQQTRSPHPSRDSPEMENLKRKLSVARRPEVGNRDTIRELNQYKQNNAALQKQIESLMAKLNQSKQNERKLTHTLEEIEKNCAEWQEKASKVEQLEKGALALQNTIDHLEYRLEVANVDKLDAEEHLFNLQSNRTPFDQPMPPKLQVPPVPHSRMSAHTSMSTVFSTGSPISHANDSQDPTTLAAFIAHIERLQEQLKQKESHTADLEQENKRLRQDYENLEREYQELSLQWDIQGQLIRKTKESDAHIEQLRTAIIDRESIIGEKSKSLRMAERQLEHHKLLLHAEIRKHANLSTLVDAPGDPLPDLTTLASKEDIDRWIERLQARLKKEHAQYPSKERSSETAADDLRREVDFYVREIIYYKLDIKGYKSDIKKLKHIATRMGSYGSRASDLESPTPSRSSDTPSRARFPSETPRPGFSNTSSPISTGPISGAASAGRPTTPPVNLMTPDPSPTTVVRPATGALKRHPRELVGPMMPHTPMTPTRKAGINTANEIDNMDPGISPRSVARLSPERRKPTPPSPEQEKFGDMATNFPLSTPASPKRHDTQRSMSESIIQMYAAPRTPDWSPACVQDDDKKVLERRGRSASLSDTNKAKLTPERPPRPPYGLYESPVNRMVGLSTPPRMDVMAEAMRNSPDRAHPRNTSKSPASKILGLSTQRMRTGSNTATPPSLSLPIRAGSEMSSTANIQPSSPQRKLSTGSGSNIPFVIAMGSPHNPALIAPTAVITPTTCSITGKCAPLNVSSPTSRTGLGGTMASSTPLTSPISPTDASKSSYFSSALPIARAQPSPTTKPGSSTHIRNTGLSLSSFSMHRSHHAENAAPRSAGGANTSHSRNGSGSSFSLMIKGKGKTRKESISNPTPLASPFDIDRGNGGNQYGVGIGEAI